jgi:hypothetical protein
MPTNYSFQFYQMDPGNPPARGTALNPITLTVTDQNDNGFVRPGEGDTVGGFTVTAVYVGDTITVRVGGVNVTITGVTFYRSGAPPVFMPTDGTVLVPSSFRSSTWVPTSTEYQVGPIPCFTRGTLIRVAQGEVPVETLRRGDLVATRDNGLQPIRWIGRRQVGGTGKFAPIRFAPGAMGNTRALLVSPQHRMVVRDWRAQLYFGQDEVLVAAHQLAGCDRIHVNPMPMVEYVHVMFDRHEIIFAEGAETESFHAGDTILAKDSALRAEIGALFPQLLGAQSPYPTALPCVRGREAALLAPA